MKTQREIYEEAQRLEQLGRQYWLEHRQSERRAGTGAERTRVLLGFPRTETTSYDASEQPRTRQIRRWIEVGLDSAVPQYFLMQAWAERPAAGGSADHADEFVELDDDSVEEVLREGYARVEADALAERLAPIVTRLEEIGFCDGMDAAMEEVEAAIGASELNPDTRLGVRANVIEFLEGRMKPSDFISEVIECHYEREALHETVAEYPGERLVIE